MSKPQSLESARVMDDVGMKLLQAAEIIRERGWCQGKANIDGRVCAGSAIGIVCGENGYPNFDAGIQKLVWKRLARYLGYPYTIYSAPPTWNDELSRTAAEVISALTAAAFQEGEGK